MRVNLVIGEGRPPLIARRLEQGCGDRDREEQAGVAPAAHPPHAAVGRAAPPENELRHHRDDSSEDHRPAEPYPLGGETEGERAGRDRSEEHTSELQSLMRISYAVFCLKK